MKKDTYLEQDFKDNPSSFELDRRDFLKRMGGGLLITFSLRDYPILFGTGLLQDEQPGLNAYLKIGEDERVSLYAGR